MVVRRGTDLKVVMPQWSLREVSRMHVWDFPHRYLQPLDDPAGTNHLDQTVKVARRMGWGVSTQVHKLVGWP